MTLFSSASEESIENPTVSAQNVELFGVFGKPNAIVRPVRRMEPQQESKSLVEMAAASQNHTEPVDVSTDLQHFSKQLEVKLKNLHSDKRNTSKIVIILTFILLIYFTRYYICGVHVDVSCKCLTACCRD